MFNKDLIYICEMVNKIPEGAFGVRLDRDGEICFDEPIYNFYPEDMCTGTHPKFTKYLTLNTGKLYTLEDFLACKEYLVKQETSVDDSTDPVIEKVKLRIAEITKRHEQALQEELKPLLEVLQRKGETL